jgi:hypothetical protein
MMSFPVEAAAVRANLASDYPRLHAFLDRVHARPAYRRALERGGPYTCSRPNQCAGPRQSPAPGAVDGVAERGGALARDAGVVRLGHLVRAR